MNDLPAPGKALIFLARRLEPVPRSRVQESLQDQEDQGTPKSTPPDKPASPLVPVRPPPRRPHPFLALVRRRLAEVVIVFVGVYAAFLLNRWQSYQQDRLAHRQILQSLAEEIDQAVINSRREAAESQKLFDEFERQLRAGEMPELHLKPFATDYDPADDVILSETGAERLLDYKTLRALRNVSSIDRSGTMLLRNRQQLSYELVAPLAGAPAETFYDPQTKQLRKKFKWYEDESRVNRFMQEDLRAHEELLAQIRAELAGLQ